MGLVAYSDSEGSDSESNEAQKPTAKPAPNPNSITSTASAKPTFQKIVDRSNPHKLRVSLPAPRAALSADDTGDGAPPAKRPRTTDGGLFSGINSFLPAPKRSGEAAKSNGLAGRQSGARVGLKTGPEPAFVREPAPSSVDGDTDNKAEDREDDIGVDTTAKMPRAVKLVGKATMFKPLSVARKGQKRRSIIPPVPSESSKALPIANKPSLPPTEPPTQKKKVSLFSISKPDDTESTPSSHEVDVEYKPMFVDKQEGQDPPEHQEGSEPPALSSSAQRSEQTGPQTLDDLAANLPPSARRQLLGRHAKNAESVISLSTFNTDVEYAANEELRAKGETVTHNPVRAIAPGKHSLKQLVNAAVTQRDALEESFAAGRRNKREAGSRYGW